MQEYAILNTAWIFYFSTIWVFFYSNPFCFQSLFTSSNTAARPFTSPLRWCKSGSNVGRCI